jgi:hypothetical protein
VSEIVSSTTSPVFSAFKKLWAQSEGADPARDVSGGPGRGGNSAPAPPGPATAAIGSRGGGSAAPATVWVASACSPGGTPDANGKSGTLGVLPGAAGKRPASSDGNRATTNPVSGAAAGGVAALKAFGAMSHGSGPRPKDEAIAVIEPRPNDLLLVKGGEHSRDMGGSTRSLRDSYRDRARLGSSTHAIVVPSADSPFPRPSEAPINGHPGAQPVRQRMLRLASPLLLASASAQAASSGWMPDPIQGRDSPGRILMNDADTKIWTRMDQGEAECAMTQMLQQQKQQKQQVQQQQQQQQQTGGAKHASGSSASVLPTAEDAAAPPLTTRGIGRGSFVFAYRPGLPVARSIHDLAAGSAKSNSPGQTSADHKATLTLEVGSSGDVMLMVDQERDRRPLKRDPNESAPLPDVLKPGDQDVLLGRGGT